MSEEIYKRIADLTMDHWKRSLATQDISPALAKFARRLVQHGHLPNLDTKEIDQILKGEAGEKKPVASTPPNRVFNPAGTFKIQRLDQYAWQVTPTIRKRNLIKRLNPIDGRHNIHLESATIRECSLSWYKQHRLIQIKDSAWKNRKLTLYYLIGTNGQLYRLNGTSPPIHMINKEEPIQLEAGNALSYLCFFCFFVRGAEGPFYLLESKSDPILKECLAVPESKANGETALKIIEGAVKPARFEGIDDKGRFLCDAVCFYSNALFLVNFAIASNGMIEMLDDEPIAGDLPFRIDAPIA